MGPLLRALCQRPGLELGEGHAMPAHVHLCRSIPPQYRVAKAAIRIQREFLGRERHFTGVHFGARGYCVRTTGLDEHVIHKSIRNPASAEKRQEQIPLKGL